MNSTIDWRSTRGSLSKVTMHFVFVTKYRRAVLTSSMLRAMEEDIERICQVLDCTLIEMNGEADRTHLLIQMPPTLSPAQFAHRAKGATSRLIRMRFWSQVRKQRWGGHLWSASYCVVSCGAASIDIVRSYIETHDRPA